MSTDTFSTLQTAEATLRPSLISPAHTCRDPVPTFPAPFATTVFSQCSGRWFEASLRRAAPKGHATFIYSYSTAVGEPAINQPAHLLRSCSQREFLCFARSDRRWRRRGGSASGSRGERAELAARAARRAALTTYRRLFAQTGAASVAKFGGNAWCWHRLIRGTHPYADGIRCQLESWSGRRRLSYPGLSGECGSPPTLSKYGENCGTADAEICGTARICPSAHVPQSCPALINGASPQVSSLGGGRAGL